MTVLLSSTHSEIHPVSAEVVANLRKFLRSLSEKFSAKGLRVNVSGRIETRSYESEGKKVYTTDLIAERIEFVDFKERETFTPNEFKGINADIPF